MIFNLSFIVLAITAIAECYVSYGNFKVYKVLPETEEHVLILSDLQKQYDFWTDKISIGKNSRVMVPPSKDEEFREYVSNLGIEPVLSISNVQNLIRAQLTSTNVTRNTQFGSLNWNQYHNLQQIHAWLDELQDLYPGVVTTITIGRSNEGREIKGVIIDFRSGNRGSNPLVAMIEGGIHSAEWISPATVTWIIKEFLSSNDSDVRHMAEAFIWHIFPIINPDGYAYTFSTNRLWRKNRNTLHTTNCTAGNDWSNGVDLNRNFNFLWMKTGASMDPCSQNFAGPHAASEPETRALSNYVSNLKSSGNMVYYFAIHSYSQLTLIPHSHLSGTDVLQVANFGDLYEIAIRGAKKLKEVHGTVYEVGTSPDLLYEMSGTSFDYVKGVLDVPIVYLFELRDVGEYGCLLPADQIIPNSEEFMAALVETDRAARELGYYSRATSFYLSTYMTSIICILIIFIIH